MSSLNSILKLKNNMPPVDFWYVLVKRSFFQNMKRKKIWHHLNTLKPGPELSKIEAVCQPDWLSICHYGFWKYYIVLFSEAFCGCSYVCPILSHFCQPIKSYSHLKFWSAKFYHFINFSNCYILVTEKNLRMKFWLQAPSMDP